MWCECFSRKRYIPLWCPTGEVEWEIIGENTLIEWTKLTYKIKSGRSDALFILKCRLVILLYWPYLSKRIWLIGNYLQEINLRFNWNIILWHSPIMTDFLKLHLWIANSIKNAVPCKSVWSHLNFLW